MKLAGKLAATLIVVTALIFGVRGVQNARRQMAAAEQGIRDTQWLIGRALRPALVHIWSTEGRERSLEMVSYANERVRRARPDVDMEIRCVSLNLSEPGAIAPRVGALDGTSPRDKPFEMDALALPPLRARGNDILLRRPALPRQCGGAIRQSGAGLHARGRRAVARLPMARQRARALERGRARGRAQRPYAGAWRPARATMMTPTMRTTIEPYWPGVRLT